MSQVPVDSVPDTAAAAPVNHPKRWPILEERIVERLLDGRERRFDGQTMEIDGTRACLRRLSVVARDVTAGRRRRSACPSFLGGQLCVTNLCGLALELPIPDAHEEPRGVPHLHHDPFAEWRQHEVSGTILEVAHVRGALRVHCERR